MKKAILAGVVSVVAIGGIVTWGVSQSKIPGVYDDFAQCITDSGTKFYGAFWCPHCADQKKMFGTSAKLLPYIECSTADGKDKLPICTDNNIESFPTWEFIDGSRLTGTIELSELSEKTMCTLPEETK
ncbi:MAG: hypothetical protein KBB88_01290 [Candidatus Pacebacteria bacterium]|nr:hypothetical protein [Candidatus Paceibacterota bacterium]